MLTVALQSMLTRMMQRIVAAAIFGLEIGEDGVGLRNFFFRLGLDHRAQPVAITVEDVRHRARRGQDGVGEAPVLERLQGSGGGQARVRQRAAKTRVLCGLRLRDFPQRCGRFRVLVLPQRLAGQDRLRAETNDPSALLMQRQRDRIATPAEQRFGASRLGLTVLRGHLSLKRAARNARHLRSRELDIFDMPCCEHVVAGRVGCLDHAIRA